MSNLDELIKNSRYAHKEMKANLENDAETRWLNKKVYESRQLYQGDRIENVELIGTGTLEISKDIDGKNNLLLTVNTKVENVNPRPSAIIKIKLNREDLSLYNRISLWVYPKATGYQNFYFHFNIGNNGNEQVHAPSLEPNVWNHVIWEIKDIERDCVNYISINPGLMGCPPEAEPTLRVFVGDIIAEKVDVDYDEGWMLDERIAYCHSGYFTNANKVALTQQANNNVFRIYNNLNEVVFIGKVEKVITDFGSYYKMDFSEFKKDGEYYLQIDDRRTHNFLINDTPFASATWKSINFLRMLRCGEDVPGVHSPCHLNCKSVHSDGRSVPNYGGWHDAGDVSQFEICTAEMAHAILDLADKVKDIELKERLLEEGRVGINWLLRTRFGDGMRALAVTYSIWRSNILKPDNKTVLSCVAENGPFENFCATAALAVAARLYKEEDPIFADWCLRAATEDFEFAKVGYEQGIHTKRWGPNIDSQVCGEGILAACELYELTKDELYITIANEYANIVLSCQQSIMPDWEIPIRGFFYEDPNHTKLLTYEHRGHEQTPVQGLARLCEVAPNHAHYDNWKNGLELYREYILETFNKTEPYGLLPAHVYDVNKINMARFTVPSTYGTQEKAFEDLKNQIRTGLKLNEGIYLRRFPIAIQRRGYHATLLSKAKGITSVAKVLKDKKLQQIAIDQLEWILGKNPFASSTMYGEGHNYHPLYVAFSKQLVGALPVGIKTLGDHDAPYWPTINNAVYKEIWGHTTGKFLWVLADLCE
ncbi:MAG: hypothetical protein K0Q49_1882 [Haloplasmataceae bacterium]|jgi:hypothetical protein|nr:hypothetical protein [Haloplasmataceae bacterium]